MVGTDEAERLPAEARARSLIDAQLQAAGWVVQDSKALEDLDNLPAPEVIAREIVEDLTAALEEFAAVAAALERASGEDK